MRCGLTRVALLESARSIALCVSGDADADKLASARNRANHLIQLLETSLHTFLLPTDTDAAVTELDDVSPGPVVDADALEAACMTRTGFFTALARMPWLPVFHVLPASLSPELPWSPQARPPFMAPLAVRPAGDAWFASATYGLLDAPRDLSVELKRWLGFHHVISATKLAQQLCAIASMHSQSLADASVDTASARDVVRHKLALEVPQLIQRICGGLVIDGSVDEEELARVKSVFAGKHWFWTGALFVSPARVAFACPPKSGPYLHAVPLSLLPHKQALNLLGIQVSACRIALKCFMCCMSCKHASKNPGAQQPNAHAAPV